MKTWCWHFLGFSLSCIIESLHDDNLCPCVHIHTSFSDHSQLLKPQESLKTTFSCTFIKWMNPVFTLWVKNWHFPSQMFWGILWHKCLQPAAAQNGTLKIKSGNIFSEREHLQQKYKCVRLKKMYPESGGSISPLLFHVQTGKKIISLF